MEEVQEAVCNNNELITAMIGVIGTLLGTILGWVLNNISDNGRLNIYVSKWEDSFLQHDDVGSMKSSKCIEETQLYSYNLCLDIYNSCAEPRIMRDIRIVFNNGNKDIEYSVPKDDSSRRSSGHIARYDEIGPITIPAKSVLQLNLHNGKWTKDNCPLYIWEVKKVFLEYRNDKNRKKRILLKREDYNRYFENHPQEEKENG